MVQALPLMAGHNQTGSHTQQVPRFIKIVTAEVMTLNPRAWAGENPEKSGYSSLLSQARFPKVSGTNVRYGHCKVE